jgi:hypothetical protein
VRRNAQGYASKNLLRCRGAIKTREGCAIKVRMMRVTELFCLRPPVANMQNIPASAEDRALRGRNLSAV